MKKLKVIIIIILSLVYAALGYKYYGNLIQSGKVRAFGPLRVTFPDTPLFDEQNWFPGKSVSKTISVENTDSFSHIVAIKPANPSNGLANSLLIVISSQGVPVYQNNLPDFFNEKSVNLFTLNARQQQSFDITLSMKDDAGDEFQEKKTSFDLIAGIETNTFNTIPTIEPFPTIKTIPSIPAFPSIKPFRERIFSARSLP